MAIAIVLVHNGSAILHGAHSIAVKLFQLATTAGWAGVELFFVLSGFLITGILISARGAPGFFRTFYVRRTLRIFPLYYAVLAIAFFLVPLIDGTERWADVAHRNQVFFWTYLSNWSNAFGHAIPGLGHFWSLAVEEQFYLVWPVVVFMLPVRSLGRLCAALVIGGPVLRMGMYVAGVPIWGVSEFTVARWDALAAGSLLAVMRLDGTWVTWLSRWWRHPAAAAVVAAIAIVVANRSYHENEPMILVLGQTPVIVMATCLVYVAAAAPDRFASGVRTVLSSRWLRFLGKYSYAIYIFHVPVDYALAPAFQAWVNAGTAASQILKTAGYVGVVAALSIVAAMISWRVLEAPMLRLKDVVAPRLPLSSAPSPS